MPPKKKKAPVVVGTVSTRSTRRQSIVHIEIPKSNRSNKSSTKTGNDAKTDIPAPKEQEFARKIKNCYKKFIGSGSENSSKNASQEALEKDNKALLEILQDWEEDDEDQTEKRHASSSSSARNKLRSGKSIFITNENESNLVNQYSANKEMELMLSEGLDNDEETCADDSKNNQNVSHNFEPEDGSGSKDDSKTCEDVNFEATRDDNSSPNSEIVRRELEEVIIEENASIPYADDMMVNENPLDNDTEEIIIIEHDMTSSPEPGDRVEKIVEENTQSMQIEDTTSENSQSNSEIEQISVANSETDSQNPSTAMECVPSLEQPQCDKIDDATDKIEENSKFDQLGDEGQENLNQDSDETTVTSQEKSDSSEQITDQDGEEKIASDIVCATENTDIDLLEEMKEENIADAPDDTKNTEVVKECDDAFIMETTDNATDISETVEEIKETSDTVPEDEDTSAKKEEVEAMECDVEAPSEPHGSQGNEKDIEETRTSDNSEETSSDFSNEKKEELCENLENKVAELNLRDESQSEEVKKEITAVKYEDDTVAEDLVQTKIDIVEKTEPVPKKTGFKDKKAPKESTKGAKTSKSQEFRSKSQKTDRIAKPTKNKPSKAPTFKTKDKKMKESRLKKNTSEKSKKTTKPTTKESEKSEKKDKKLGKFEEALKNIGKTDSESEEIRRSSRIKSINVLNKKTTGWGLVKSKSEPAINEGDMSDSNSFQTESDKSTPTASPKVTSKDRKSKPTESSVQNTPKSDNQMVVPFKSNVESRRCSKDPIVEARLKQFVHLKENLYKTDRMVCKEAKKMACDCFLTCEELEANEYGCGEDCLNRLLLIECGNLCAVGDRCTNKRFQRSLFAPVEVFNTEKKGLGLRAAANIPFGEFILEYVGEVLDTDEFDKRAEVYSQVKNIHYYFMALRADAVIDATMKGNISRFINHSCDPNAETQKWTVNGEIRIGFFSTRTILAGEEVTFDYRFQRYGKEAQKCYCGASICRGWLGEQPDSDEDEDDEEDDEESEGKPGTPLPAIKGEISDLNAEETKMEIGQDSRVDSEKIRDSLLPTAKPSPAKKKAVRKKPRFEMFEEVDQLNEEIEMLVTTGLKNQAHTLKLSRMMVRAKEPQQRAKLLRVLRRGELPCRRLFLDYHGLRLMHGYMIDAQQLVVANKKFDSLRLEMLQTLAVLPIPNKSMLQDSKVLSTVEKWSSSKDLTSPADSESNSPKDAETTPKPTQIKEEETKEPLKDELEGERSTEDQEEEIRFLATKLLEEWKNLKEVFRIPKKERIEQMKEHEREANKKFMQTNQNVYGTEEERKMDRYRGIPKGKIERDFQNFNRKSSKSGDKPSAEFLRLSKIERRKLFALQHELKEEERKLKQREMWRQHEMNCMMIGVDPRFTAPFDPGRGYQYIWNQQIGQWQTCPTESNPRLYSSQPSNQLPNLNLPPPHLSKPHLPGYQYASPMGMIINQTIPSMQLPPLPIAHNPAQGQMVPPLPHNSAQGQMPPLPHNQMQGQLYHGHTQMAAPTPPLPKMPPPQETDDPSQVKFMGPIPPPVKLPPKWKCAKDKYGRPYYYHIRIRKSQWEPPPLIELSDSESSSESSTVSSDSSSENSDSDDDVDDTKLLLEVRRQMESLPKTPEKVLPINPAIADDVPTVTPSPDEKSPDVEMSAEELKQKSDGENRRPSIDVRLKQLELFQDDRPAKKKRRVGLCEEIIISPRTEEDKKQFKEDVKRYKANKEKLKRQREKILLQTKKQLKEIEMKKKAKEKRTKTVKVKLKEKPDFNTEAAKKIKETFRTNMASTVVSSLNAYRKPDCAEGRITNTQDFKHLARKLTHFVMLKEMKHIMKIEDLTCTDNVKVKAREFIRKYMSKFGEVYVKRSDSPDFKD